MGTRITGSTKRIEVLEALGRRTADNLLRDPVLAELAPQVVQAVERLGKAKEARKAAADRRWVARQAMDHAEEAVVDVVRAVQHGVLQGCSGNRSDAGYRELFPDGLKNLTGGKAAARGQALKFLAARLAGQPTQAEAGHLLDGALTARVQAIDAWEQAIGAERAAVHALEDAVREFLRDFTVARCQATVLLKDPAGVRAFFPTLPSKAHEAPGTAGGQDGQPGPIATVSGPATPAPATPAAATPAPDAPAQPVRNPPLAA